MLAQESFNFLESSAQEIHFPHTARMTLLSTLSFGNKTIHNQLPHSFHPVLFFFLLKFLFIYLATNLTKKKLPPQKPRPKQPINLFLRMCSVSFSSDKGIQASALDIIPIFFSPKLLYHIKKNQLNDFFHLSTIKSS